jgi:hypothetical protein
MKEEMKMEVMMILMQMNVMIWMIARIWIQTKETWILIRSMTRSLLILRGKGVVGNLAPGLFRVIKGLLKKQVHRIMNKG